MRREAENQGGRRTARAALATIALFLLGTSNADAQVVRQIEQTTYSPTSIHFKRVKVGNSSDVRRVVIDRANVCIDISPPHRQYDCMFWSSDVAISGDGFRLTLNTCASTSGPSCIAWVKFKPTRRGRSDGFLRVDSGPIVGVPLKGKGCRKVKGDLRCWRKGAR